MARNLIGICQLRKLQDLNTSQQRVKSEENKKKNVNYSLVKIVVKRKMCIIPSGRLQCLNFRHQMAELKLPLALEPAARKKSKKSQK